MHSLTVSGEDKNEFSLRQGGDAEKAAGTEAQKKNGTRKIHLEVICLLCETDNIHRNDCHGKDLVRRQNGWGVSFLDTGILISCKACRGS